MKYAGNNIILKLSSTPPVTVDLPISSGTAVKIDLTGEMTATANVYIAADFYWTIATSDATAATRIASDATRGKLPAGFYNFEVSAVHDDNLYILSQGSAVTDGISYNYSDFS